MIRLFSIEFFKLRNSRYFWVLAGLFAVFLLSVPIASKSILNYLASSTGLKIPVLGLSIDHIPIFDFVDIWQNLTWVYSAFSIALGFIIVISICNEYSYGTVKQNVIDGLSREEFLWAKVIMIIVLSVIVSLITLIIGLIMGFIWSPVTEFTFIVKHIEFIPAYCLHLIAFQLFCLVVSIIVKQSGIVISFLIFYIYIIEKIITSIIEYELDQPVIADLFPIRAIGNIIRFPFTKYFLSETQTFVSGFDLSILLGYIGLLLFLAHWKLVKRDLV